MPWETVGQLNIEQEWKTLGTPVIGGDVFRIFQYYNEYPAGYAWLSFIYANGGRYGYKRIYPSEEFDLIIMPVPQILVDKDLTVRYPTMRISPRTMQGITQPQVWQITLQRETT